MLRDLSRASPRTYFLGCIYRSHPALEMGLSASCRNGELLSVRGLHEAFAQSPTFFDRWAVQSDQRNRWQDYTEIAVPNPLTDFWKLRRFNAFRRVVLCHGARPIAYLAAELPPGSTWTRDELARIDNRYRSSSNALRLAAMAWRAMNAPEDQASQLLHGARAVVVLAENGAVLSCSPEVKRWLPRDAELGEFVEFVGQEARESGTQRLRRFEARFSAESSASRSTWKVIRLMPTMDLTPTRLAERSTTSLAPRELELCEWLVAGRTNASIAAEMGVRPSTVKTMLERLYERRGVHGRVALVKQLLTHA